jgi:hypothetical protein
MVVNTVLDHVSVVFEAVGALLSLRIKDFTNLKGYLFRVLVVIDLEALPLLEFEHLILWVKHYAVDGVVKSFESG